MECFPPSPKKGRREDYPRPRPIREKNARRRRLDTELREKKKKSLAYGRRKTERGEEGGDVPRKGHIRSRTFRGEACWIGLLKKKGFSEGTVCTERKTLTGTSTRRKMLCRYRRGRRPISA